MIRNVYKDVLFCREVFFKDLKAIKRFNFNVLSYIHKNINLHKYQSAYNKLILT